MLNLSEIIVCPVTHRALRLYESTDGNYLKESLSGNIYRIIDGVFSMFPDPLPAGIEQKKLIWEELQANGYISYTLAPALNLTSDTEVASVFSAFMDLSGLTLDVGCGPQRERPQYANTKHSMDYIGIDPLIGLQPRKFQFIHGIGEVLPFPTNTFDNVIFCSSLDHMLDFKLSLEEAVRVLKPDGKLNLLLDNISDNHSKITIGKKALSIMHRGSKQILKGLKVLKLSETVIYAKNIMSLKIPSGAMDYFHLYFPNPDEVVDMLDSLGCKKRNSQIMDNQIALQSIKVAE